MEEILEVPPEWNEVRDMMMEDKDVLPEAEGSTKRKRDEVAQVQRKRRISGLRNMDIFPQSLGEHKIPRGSILKIGMKFSKKKTNGKRQISGRESYRCCLAAEV